MPEVKISTDHNEARTESLHKYFVYEILRRLLRTLLVESNDDNYVC